MPVGKPLHLRLFMEGLEVPVVSAQVSINPNAPAVAAIQIVPLDTALDFHPRTMVHLFYLDHALSSDLPNKDQAKERTTFDWGNPLYLDNYKLLFTGETIGFSFVQSPMSRGLIIQCLDFSSYWDAAHATAIEYGPGGNLFSNQAALWGSNSSAGIDDLVSQQAEKITQWIRSKPRTPGLETVSGLAGGIIHMLEAIGGVPRHSKGINDFFTVAELRCRVLQQITAEENDNTASRLLSVKVFDEWLRNGLQNIGQQVTFRDMMKLLFQYIHYDVVPNPVAKFNSEVRGTQTVTKAGIGKNPFAIKAVIDLNEVLQDFQTKVSGSDGRIIEGLIEKIASNNATKVRKVAKLLNDNILDKTSKQIDYLLQAENILKNPAETRFVDAEYWIKRAIDDLSVSGTTTQGSSKAARLHTQIIRPDCWFASPPKCNVIFPEQFTELSYDRTHIQEVTRTLILSYDTLIGQDHLLADRTLAPNIGTDSKSLIKSGIGRGGYRVLMPHEYHTGIVPRVEWIANTSSGAPSSSVDDKKKLRGQRLSWAQKIALFHFFKFRFAPRQASVTGRFNPVLVCGFPALIIKQPFIIPGISQADNAIEGDMVSYVAAQAKKYTPPVQFLGMIGALSHTINQDGGTTSISLDHVRRHAGIDDEFLNVLVKDTLHNEKRRIKVTLKIEDVRNNPQLLTVLIGVTPQDTEVREAQKSSKAKNRQRDVKVSTTSVDASGKKVTTTSDKSVPYRSVSSTTLEDEGLVRVGTIEGVDKKDLKVPSVNGRLSTGSKGVYGKIIGVEVLNSTRQLVSASQAFSAVTIYEEVQVPAIASRPLEDILRPTFFSEKYSNTQIGKDIYQPFFGVNAVVDDIQNGALPPPSQDPAGFEVDPTMQWEELAKEMSEEAGNASQVSLEKAVDFISYVYGVVKAQGKDVDTFIRQYNQRPIATMTQLLGSPDLELSISGTVATITKGTYGFHTGAIDQRLIDAGPLVGLTDDPSTQLKRIDGAGSASTIPDVYDVRRAKRDRVLAYIEVLRRGVGLLG